MPTTPALGRRHLLAASATVALATALPAAAQPDPLASWNDTPSKRAILAFVARVTTQGPDFVAPEARIATFDNDGTLWAEQPMYFQFAFALDRVKQLAPQHPEWREREPFKSVLAGDLKAVMAGGEHALAAIIGATHAGMTPEAFTAEVRAWLATARHPTTGRPYTGMVYQPMLELLAFLRGQGFRTWIVSGGGVEFMRAWVEATYGIPPEQVIGSTIKTSFVMRDGRAELLREPAIDFIDDKAGKPIAINRIIGRRPIAAFGNSDGDLQMLQWTMAGPGPRFAALVHHTDAAREWAYDHPSAIGELNVALIEARARGWTVIDMKTDWAQVFPG